MGIIDKVKLLPNPMFILFVSSKIVVGIGIGILISGLAEGAGLWILILGIMLSIPPAIKVFGK